MHIDIKPVKVHNTFGSANIVIGVSYIQRSVCYRDWARDANILSTRSRSQPDPSSACTSERSTSTNPSTQQQTPTIWPRTYCVLKRNHVKSKTQGMVQQSKSITLVIDVYRYALVAVVKENKRQVTYLLTAFHKIWE
jgi:hypothetical protein